MPKKRKNNNMGWRIAIPLCITTLVVWILFSEDFHPEAFKSFHFGIKTIVGIALALIAMVIQNWAMGLRFRKLSDNQLSLRGGIRVQQMMEFTSAATPSSVGGSAVLFLFLSTEGVRAGKATAITFSALFLDQLLLFLLSLGVIILSTGAELFGRISLLASSFRMAFYLITLIVGVWSTVLFIALFIKPQILSGFVKWLSKRRLLSKYSSHVEKISDDLFIASKQLGDRSLKHWLGLLLLTAITWCARFAIAVCLIYGFALPNSFDTGVASILSVAYAEQIVIWMLSMIMPTPGGSGFAEYMFQGLYGNFFGSTQIALIVAVIWRCFSAYIYFLTGGILLSFRWNRIQIMAEDNNKYNEPLERRGSLQ